MDRLIYRWVEWSTVRQVVSSTCQPIYLCTRQHIKLSTVCLTIDLSTCRPINLSTCRPVNKSTCQPPTCLPLDHLTHRYVNLSRLPIVKLSANISYIFILYLLNQYNISLSFYNLKEL